MIYKISTTEAGSEAVCGVFGAKKEITALAMDGAGNVYAAGVGTKGAPGRCRRCR